MQFTRSSFRTTPRDGILCPAGGYEGAVPARLEDVTHDHPLIQFRKSHLTRYLTRLVSAPYDAKMVGYLDLVGRIHTPNAGSAELDVPWFR